MKLPSWIALGCLVTFASAAEEPLWNLPSDLAGKTEKASFRRGYAVGTWINPFYLRGDFDGDGKPDYALLVESQPDHKKGLVIWLSALPNSKGIFIGAGTKFQETDDWTFFDAWQVHTSKVVRQGASEEKPPHPRGESILIEKSESASGLLYWDGRRIRWYQQAD